eukprot:5792066-Pyramimonas_sp.AAC.2
MRQRYGGGRGGSTERKDVKGTRRRGSSSKSSAHTDVTIVWHRPPLLSTNPDRSATDLLPTATDSATDMLPTATDMLPKATATDIAATATDITDPP